MSTLVDTKLVDVSFDNQSQKDINQEILPKFLFHYSPKSNRASILKNGLLVKPPQGRMWDLHPPGIFLFGNPWNSYLWQYSVRDCITRFKPDSLKWEKDDNGLDGDIWIVNTQDLQLQADVFFRNGVFSIKDIDANNLFKTSKHTLLILDRLAKKYNAAKYYSSSPIRLNEIDMSLVENVFTKYIKTVV